MKNNNNSEFTRFSRPILPIAVILLFSGCALQGKKQVLLTPTVDQNAVQIIDQVKTQPSMISSGGMVYDLFVGGHFNAQYNDKNSTLTLTDLENTNSCQYSENGTLKINDDTVSAYVDSCNQLSINTIQTLSQQEEEP